MTIVANDSLTISKVNDGVGIQNTDITYANSTSGTTAPSTGWTSSVPTLVKGQYLWTKTVWTSTDTSTKTAYSVSYNSKDGTNGTDGTSGIIVSSAAPTSPKTGQLWQDTSTTPQLVKKWTGASWVIWELYVENMNVNNLSALSPNLGNITGGAYTSWDILVQETNDIQITRYFILNGVFIDNGLIRTISINTRNIINRVINENSTLQASEIESINGCEIISGKNTFYNTINNKAYNILNGLTPNEILQGIDSEGFTRPPGISYIEFYNNYNYNIERRKYDVFFNMSSSYGMYSASLFTQPNFGAQGKTALSIHSSGHITIESPENLIFGDLDVTGGIRQTSKTASVTIGAGLILSLERRGEMVIAILTGTINSSLTSGKQFVGKIPLGYRPNTTANIPVHITSSYNSAHIDAGIDGVCTWWGPATSSGYPRGTQMWFTNDSLPN